MSNMSLGGIDNSYSLILMKGTVNNFDNGNLISEAIVDLNKVFDWSD